MTGDGSQSWVMCPHCEGAEGWHDDDEWHDCPSCEGSGGWPSDPEPVR